MTGKRETPTRKRTERGGRDRLSGSRDARVSRPTRSAPQTNPTRRQTPATSTGQAKARAKARKAKAPKAVRVPLRERLIARVTSIDLDPRTLVKKVPFVVLVIGALGFGLALTLWLSTDSAERSYELGSARDRNRALTQQKESLEREVLEAQAAPALAEAARNLGMIPSRDTAHLVQDPAGNWVVVGDPKPAEGTSPPPLNSRLPDPTPAAPPVPVNRTEVPVLVPSPPKPVTGPAPTQATLPPGANPEVLVRAPATPTPAAPAPAPTASAPAPTASAPAPTASAPAPDAPTATPTPVPLAEPMVPSGPLPGPPAAVPST